MRENHREFESGRLKLEPFSKADCAVFHTLNTDPFIRRHLWDDEIISLESAEELLALNDRHFRESGYGLWKIFTKPDGELIGYAGLWHFFDENQPQLLYALLEEFTGKRYAREAAALVLDYAFSVLKFDYLTAATDLPNVASHKVARALGMSLQEQRMENGKETLFFRVKREEWRQG